MKKYNCLASFTNVQSFDPWDVDEGITFLSTSFGVAAFGVSVSILQEREPRAKSIRLFGISLPEAIIAEVHVMQFQSRELTAFNDS